MFLLTALVTVLALIMYLFFAFNVGKARARCGVSAPAITGNEEFERYYRVQMNTLEQIVIFIPALWLFANYVNYGWAAFLGFVWIIGRIMYARGYYRDSKKRASGFLISMGVTSVLLIGSLLGIIVEMNNAEIALNIVLSISNSLTNLLSKLF